MQMQKTAIHFRISKDLKEDLEVFSKENDYTVSTVIREAIKQFIGVEDKPVKKLNKKLKRV